jgi:hypothetical protein
MAFTVATNNLVESLDWFYPPNWEPKASAGEVRARAVSLAESINHQMIGKVFITS